MRYLILSDLHSNLEALQAVIAATEGAYDRLVCCGDLVGYGPDPNAVVNWARDHVTAAVRGNHDKACSGVTQAEDFNDAARASAFWTRGQLTSDNLQYLVDLPRGPRDIAEQFAILHGSPRDEDEYIHAPLTDAGVFEFLSHRVSFFGHTHLQGGFIRCGNRIEEVPLKPISRDAGSALTARGTLEIQADETCLLNPGSVGQPRDRDSRAAFAIYDTAGLVEYGRVSYDVDITVNKILQAGLPEFLAYRLLIGR